MTRRLSSEMEGLLAVFLFVWLRLFSENFRQNVRTDPYLRVHNDCNDGAPDKPGGAHA